MEQKKVKIGDTVVIVPAKEAEDLRHNHAKEVPAIVTVAWNPKLVNARVFVDGFHVPAHVTSVPHQSTVAAGGTCWRHADEDVQLPEGDERAQDFLKDAVSDQDQAGTANATGNSTAAGSGE